MARRHPLEMKEWRLQQLNRILLPLLRAARRYARAWRVLLPDTSGVTRVSSTRDYTATIIQLNLPASHPLIIAMYVSAQQSSPLTPSQLKPKIRRLRQLIAQARGKTFHTADILYVIVSPKGYTRGSLREAVREGVNAVKTIEEAAARLRRYLRKRLTKLLQSIQGKNVWGELPLLLYALTQLAIELGEQDIKGIDYETAIHAALEGAKIPVHTP